MRTFLALVLGLFTASALADNDCARDCTNFTYCQFWTGACATGNRQSPIATFAANRRRVPNLPVPNVAAYGQDRRYNMQATNTRTTVKVRTAVTRAVRILYNGEYWLDEFHFHFPAEHVVDVWRSGNRRPVGELHLVHKNANQDHAVVFAVPIYLGTTSNAALEALRTAGMPPACAWRNGPNQLQIGALLPSQTDHYMTYEGSLTTPTPAPPCAEVVTFLLMDNGITATQAQINFLKITMNARPVQFNPQPVSYRP